MTENLLLVSYYSPCRAHAGGLRLLDLYREIRRLSPDLRLELLTCDHGDADWGDEAVDTLFDMVHRIAPVEFRPTVIRNLAVLSGSFDLIDFQYHQSGALMSACRKRWPAAVMVFSPMESLIRSLVKGWLTDRGSGASRILPHPAEFRVALEEAIYIWRADHATFVSEPDRKVASLFKRPERLHCITTALSQQEFPPDGYPQASLDSKVIVFAAYFGSKTNREALLWYCQYVHPVVRRQVTSYILKVVGRGLDAKLMEKCAGDGIDFIGPVEYMTEALLDASCGIAPALGGGGVRGKIHQYAAVGLPCVASGIACEGLAYVPGVSILSAGNEEVFASHCLSLLKSRELRRQMGQSAREVCIANYTWESMDEKIARAYDLPTDGLPSHD